MGLAPQQQAARLEAVVDVVVGLPHGASGEPGDGVGEPPVGPDRVEPREAGLPAHDAVDLTEGGSEVHDPGALVGVDEVARHDAPPIGSGWHRQLVEGTVVTAPHQVAAWEPAGDARALAHHRLDQLLGHDQPVDHRVGELGVDGCPGVGRKGPRRGRPHDQRPRRTEDGIVGIGQRQEHVGGLVLDVLVDVGLAELVARERRPAPGAVGHHLDVLVEEVLIPDLLQVPPDGLHVVRVKRPVRVVEIGPVADALGHGPPVVHVRAHGLAAAPGELSDTDRLDLALARDPERLLDLDLDREAVGVPSGPAVDAKAPHRAIPAEQILVGACPDVVQARTTVGGRRALVEHPRRGALATADRPFEDALAIPARELGLLDGDEVRLRRGGSEQRSPPWAARAPPGRHRRRPRHNRGWAGQRRPDQGFRPAARAPPRAPPTPARPAPRATTGRRRPARSPAWHARRDRGRRCTTCERPWPR